jgi:hypothetical protein
LFGRKTLNPGAPRFYLGAPFFDLSHLWSYR